MGELLEMLLYADDMVVLAETEKTLDVLIQKLEIISQKWALTISMGSVQRHLLLTEPTGTGRPRYQSAANMLSRLTP